MQMQTNSIISVCKSVYMLLYMCAMVLCEQTQEQINHELERENEMNKLKTKKAPEDNTASG